MVGEKLVTAPDCARTSCLMAKRKKPSKYPTTTVPLGYRQDLEEFTYGDHELSTAEVNEMALGISSREYGQRRRD